MSSLRDRYLAEIGIPAWKLRGRAAEPGAEPGAAPQVDRGAAEGAAAALPTTGRAVGAATAARRSANAPPPAVVAPAVVIPTVPSVAVPANLPGASNDEIWQTLATQVSGCILCSLHATRTQTVFGVGRRDAELLVIGEAPGADEDRQGEPFVGRAGQLLNAMLRAIGYARTDVYIANILKCRPPGNRDPQPEEAATCTPYLQQQISLVNPKVILAVGRIAAQWLLQSDSPIGRLRGRVFQYGSSGTPLIVTYHPAYLLRSPLAKATAWQDLCLVKELMSKER